MKSQKIKLNRCENYLFNKRIREKYSREWFVIIKKLTINHSTLGDGGEKTKILGDDSQENIGIPDTLLSSLRLLAVTNSTVYCQVSSINIFFYRAVTFFF